MLRAGDRWIRDAAPGETITVTVLLRPSKDISEQLLSGNYHPASREEAQQDTAADSQQIAAVRDFAAHHGLTVESADPASRRVVLTGDVEHVQQAFGIEIGQVQDAAGHTFRSYRGSVQLPASLQNAVTAVLGLDQRPVARHAATK
jgi:kumamolisin